MWERFNCCYLNYSTDSTLAESAVPPDKLDVHYAMGTFSPAGTGNISVTGVGFKPQLVKFYVLFPSGASQTVCIGAMTASTQHAVAFSYAGSSGATSSSTSVAIKTINSSSTVTNAASYISMDADGFTIDFTTYSSGFLYFYEAMA